MKNSIAYGFRRLRLLRLVMLAFLIVIFSVSGDAQLHVCSQAECDSVLTNHGASELGSIMFKKLDSIHSQHSAYSPEYLDNIYNACYSLLSEGIYNLSITLYKRGADISISSGDTLNYMYMTAFKANAYLYKGDFREVVSVMNYAYDFLKNSNIDDEFLSGYIPYMIGDAYRYLEEYDLALKYNDLAHVVFAETESDYLSSNFLIRAEILAAQKMYAKALNCLIDEIGVNAKETNTSRQWGHGVYRLLAKIYAGQKKYEKAIRELDNAEMSLGSSGSWSMLPAIAMYEKADVHVNFNNWKAGLLESKRALKQLGIDDWESYDYALHPNLQYVLSALMAYAEVMECQVRIEKGGKSAFEKLYMLYDKCILVSDLLLDDYTSVQGASILKMISGLYDKAIQNYHKLYLLSNDQKYLYNALQINSRSKVKVLSEKTGCKITENLSQNSITKLSELKRNVSNLKLEVVTAEVNNDYEKVAEATSELRILLKEYEELIKRCIPSQKEVKLDMTISQIVGLAEGSAIIDIYESQDMWFVWVLGNYDIGWYQYDKENDWEELFSFYQKNIGSKYDFRPIQESLSFISNIFCDLSNRNIEEVVIIPDKSLSSFPMDVLFECDGQSFSMHPTFSISYGYDAQGVQERKSVVGKYDQEVIAWAPAYPPIDTTELDGTLIAELVRSGRYHLPGAVSEAKAISDILNGQVITGDEATKESFFANHHKAKILHLSMHALLNRQESHLSKFLFSINDDDIHDSYLHSIELENLQLDAEMAVLSACETGLGPVKEGEGVHSLGRSFAMAGVPTTVMSLWQVPDYSTSIIMKDFYKNISNGMARGMALSKAKKSYIKGCKEESLRHPYYWAGFVLVGDSNLPLIEKAGGHTVLLFLSIGLLVVVSVGYKISYSFFKSFLASD